MLLAANLIWTTLNRGGYPPHVAVIASLLTGALLVVHFVAWMASTRSVVGAGGDVSGGHEASPSSARRLHPAGWWLLPFLLYAAANVLWVSPVPWIGWRDWIGWAQAVAVFWVVLNGIRSPAPQRMVLGVLFALGLAGAAACAYQFFAAPDWQMLGTGPRPTAFRGRGSGFLGIPNSFAGFVLLVLPMAAALALRRGASATQRVWWGWVALVLTAGLGLTISRGAWLALAVALAAWPLLMWRGRWWRRLGAAAAIVMVLGAIGFLLYLRAPPVRARMIQFVADSGERSRPIMWQAAWNLFRSAPAFGTGAGSYNVLFERHRPERFVDETLWPHNEYLNLLADYGAVGFLLFFGAAAAIVARCSRRERDEGARRRDAFDSTTVLAGAALGVLAFALHLAVEFHFKIPALALSGAAFTGIVVSRMWPAPAGPSRSARFAPFAAGAAALGTAAACGFGVYPLLRAEAWRDSARHAIDQLALTPDNFAAYRGVLTPALEALDRATKLDARNGQAWADLAYAKALWSFVEEARTAELGREAEAAATRALGCSTVCWEFWIRRGSARDMQGRWADAGDDFAAGLKRASMNANAWYYYAEHLSRSPSAREAAEGALVFCLRLDPGNTPGVALRQRLAISPKRP